jgi:hypothetical protein
MLKQTAYKIILISILCLDLKTSISQNVLDGTFVEATRPKTNDLSINLNHAIYVLDDLKSDLKEGPFSGLPYWPSFTSYIENVEDSSIKLTDKQRSFIAHIQYYRKHFKAAPVAFDECVFFNPAYDGADYILSHPYRMPEALRFYSKPITDTIITDDYIMKLKLNKPLYEILSPFYFKKTAITNREYREFVNWVRDSIIRIMLYNAGLKSMVLDTNADPPILNWKTKIDLSSKYNEENIADLYLPEMERFYKKKNWDTRKFNYAYYTIKTDTFSQRITINVYPDTLAWVADFAYGFNEPMTNMYFWNPFYDDYPVVGISKKQAEAFLNWKTAQEQKKLNKKGKGEWIVKYELPTEYEWEIVEGANVKDGHPIIYPDYIQAENDDSYITDLLLKPDKDSIPILFRDKRDSTKQYYMDSSGYLSTQSEKSNWIRNNIRSSSRGFCFSWNLRSRHSDEANRNGIVSKKRWNNDQVLKADFTQNDEYVRLNPLFSIDYDCNHISFMGDNVSEWLQETYTKNYKAIYDFRHKLLKNFKGKDIDLMLATEDYFNLKNDTDWVASGDSASLVRGSNWYDNRISGKAGKNTDGMNAKKFVNPTFQYCTLGFRYVIKVYRKDEDKLLHSQKDNIRASK